jgi:hypothetical protein
MRKFNGKHTGSEELCEKCHFLPCLYRNNYNEKNGRSALKDTNGAVLKEKRPTENNLFIGTDILPSKVASGKIITQDDVDKDRLKLKSKYKKSAIALAWNVQAFAEKFGLENIGFLTLTFADHITCPKESQKRFRSLANGVLKVRYGEYIRVLERQKNGRIHYHLLIVIGSDIRTGFDFKQISQKNYSSANKSIRDEWSFWRKTAKKYRFGRTELLPIRSTSEGIARYIGKYLGKHFEARLYSDKGVRLVEYSRGARTASTRVSVLNKGSELWRKKMALFAEFVGFRHDLGRSATFEELSELLGKKWAYFNREFILQLPVEEEETSENTAVTV